MVIIENDLILICGPLEVKLFSYIRQQVEKNGVNCLVEVLQDSKNSKSKYLNIYGKYFILKYRI
jgi:hypothetical protein